MVPTVITYPVAVAEASHDKSVPTSTDVAPSSGSLSVVQSGGYKISSVVKLSSEQLTAGPSAL